MKATIEQARLDEMRAKSVPWHKWGPYLSERQWGTVREDYSETGTLGTTSLMNRHVRAHIAGAKTVLQEFVTIISSSVLRSHSGTDATQS